MEKIISISIKTISAKYKAREPLIISFTLTNRSTKTVSVLKWNTPFEGFNSNLFQIIDPNGKLIPYKGKIVKRGKPQIEDYISIGPNDSLSSDIDLSQGYDIYEIGDHSIKFNRGILEYDLDAINKIISKTRIKAQKIISKSITLHIDELRQIPTPLPKPLIEEFSRKAVWKVEPLTMTKLGNSLYVIENQRLWKVDPNTGSSHLRAPIGDENPWKIAPIAMTSLGTSLYVVENQRLWKVNPNTGTYQLLAPAGDENPWKIAPITITSLGTSLYVIENQRLWKVNPNTGAYQLLAPAGDENPWKIAPIAMTSLGTSLYVIENQRLWKVSPNTGAYQLLAPAGDENPWKIAPIAMTSLGTSLYVIENQRLWKVNPNTGAYQLLAPAGDENPWKIVPIAMTSIGTSLYVIENQNLWRVDPTNGNYSSVDNIIFVGCTQQQMDTLHGTLVDAQAYALEAYKVLSNTPLTQRANANRYTTWFGTYEKSRYDTVTDHYLKISDDLVDKMITFHGDCNDNSYAFVRGNDQYHIHLCRLFWTAPSKGTDSQAGTIIHEMSHFNVTAGTDDHAYGQYGCESLAQSNPSEAIDNADSHEYFAENNPPLNMD